MAIYDIKPEESIIPDLGKPIQGYTVDKLELSSLDKAIAAQQEQDDKTFDIAEKNIDRITAIQSALQGITPTAVGGTEKGKKGKGQTADAVTGVRVDNPMQQETLATVKSETGIDNVFSTITMKQLTSPYGTKVIERAYSQFTNDPRIRKMVMEQMYADKYMGDLMKIKNGNLRAMAVGQYDKYRNSEILGTELDISQYQDVDLTKSIATMFKAIKPQVELEIERNPQLKATVYKNREARDKKTMEESLNALMEDAKFRNNMVANGYIDPATGEYTSSGKKYVDGLMSTFEVNSARGSIKFDPAQRGTGGRRRGGSGGSGGGRLTAEEKRYQDALNILEGVGISESMVSTHKGTFSSSRAERETLIKELINKAIKGGFTNINALDAIKANTGLSEHQLKDFIYKENGKYRYKKDLKVKGALLELSQTNKGEFNKFMARVGDELYRGTNSTNATGGATPKPSQTPLQKQKANPKTTVGAVSKSTAQNYK